MKHTKNATYQLNDIPPLGRGIALGLQHVLTMFTGNLAVALIICAGIGLDLGDTAIVLQCVLLTSGITTMVQAFGLGPVGSKLPIMMGSTFTFVGAIIAVGGNPLLGMGAAVGALIVGGLLEALLGPWIIKAFRRFLTPVVTGAVVLAIGISLLGFGVNYSAGGSGEGYGSLKNMGVALFVLVLAILLNVRCKGFVRAAAVFIAMIAGFILAVCLGMVDFTNVKTASWVSLPKPLMWGISFKLEAIIPIAILYIVSMLEFVGDTTGTCFNATGRGPTEKELVRGIRCDGLGSAFSALFNAPPNVSFSQNVGLIAITGVKSRFVVGMGGVILLLISFFPKFAMLLSVMPSSVLGGACIMMFGMIAVSGIQVITSDKFTSRDALILAVSLGVGMGFYMDPTAIAAMPSIVQTLFTGVAGTALVALLLNIILPRSIKEDLSVEPVPQEEAVENR